MKGETVAEINGEVFALKAGWYVVIAPSTPNDTVSDILEDVAG